MGNRAVIVAEDTTKSNSNEKIGIYVHWYGSEDDIKSFLNIAKERKIRGVISDSSYGWARLCQIIADTITENSKQNGLQPDYECGVGIGIVNTLDCNNYDNGVYYINNEFDIVKQTTGTELE